MGEKETRFYHGFYADFLPQLNNFIKDSGLENEVHLNFPPCPHTELAKEDFYFFMENMKECGYAVEFNKKLGLDAQHVCVVLDELAKFHATTHAFVMERAKESSLQQVSFKVLTYVKTVTWHREKGTVWQQGWYVEFLLSVELEFLQKKTTSS